MSNLESEEKYSVTQIRQAYTKHASEDTWGIPYFYEGEFISALRGEYDQEKKCNCECQS